MGAPQSVHLHVHTEYSMLQGAIRIPELVQTVGSMGMPAVAMTDLGNMFGAVQLHQACAAQNVKPIIGCEVSLKSSESEGHHLVLLASSQSGYQNLVRLVSLGWVEGIDRHGQPHVSIEHLQRYNEGLVALSGCLAGCVSQQVLLNGADAGRQKLRSLAEIFAPGHFFVELQDHGFTENRPLNHVLADLARSLDLPIVATNDCHYLERDHAHAQFALQCIGAGRTLSELQAAHHQSAEMYLKSPQQMMALFEDHPDAIRNTLLISEMCAGQCSPLSDPKLPSFDVPGDASEANYLRALAVAGLARRFAEERARSRSLDEKAYHQRLELELNVIINMGFSGYFLIVQDFINWAKDHDVPVGPGRGSGAGSLVAWALRITDLDPIVHQLLFERFLNPERVSMPDFDIDFCMDKRDRVIQYVKDKYGAESVGQIATFHQLKSRSVVRDVGRVMGMLPQEAGRIATLIPEPVQGKTVSIDDALAQEPRLKTTYDQDEAAKEVIDTARQLENLTRHAGMHAAGVVISDGPIWDHVPVFCPEENSYVTQFHKDDVEAAGLVKFDFLGLRTLTVIDIATKLIGKRPDRIDNPFSIADIPMDDAATFALLQTGETTNVFQLESSGMQNLFKQLRPDSFEDIVAAVALYRPGPMGAGMDKDFVRRKHGRQKVEYPDASLEPILKATRGVIVYQEQVMQIAQSMAGYTLGGADLLRRAMGKKKASEMEKQKAIFVDGATKLGHDRGKSEDVFELMAYFAGYGFNKSHSAAYALITYQTAYLKAHFPAEFTCATLSADKDKIDKIVRTVAEARAMGLVVLPPDANESDVDFSVVYSPDDAPDVPRLKHLPVCHQGQVLDPMGPKIRFGLGAIKGVGTAAVESILESRQPDAQSTDQQAFVDLFDFCARVDLRRVNKSVIEALVQCGAFDSMHQSQNVHRSQAFATIGAAVDRGKQITQERNSGQTNLFELMSGPEVGDIQHPGGQFLELPPWDSREQLLREKASLGFYVSGHPLDHFASELRRFCNATTESVTAIDDRKRVIVGGLVEGYRERRTKLGSTMAFFHLEDSTGRVEVIVRPKPLQAEGIRDVLNSGRPILLEGLVKRERDPNDESAAMETKILLEKVSPLSQALKDQATSFSVKLNVDAIDKNVLEQLRDTLRDFPGPCPVQLELGDPGSWNVVFSETGVYVEPSDALFTSLERLFGKKVCELR
ncbi:MAG: DNA polymerase III subunit alpha [Polyangiales bacterium]